MPRWQALQTPILTYQGAHGDIQRSRDFAIDGRVFPFQIKAKTAEMNGHRVDSQGRRSYRSFPEDELHFFSNKMINKLLNEFSAHKPFRKRYNAVALQTVITHVSNCNLLPPIFALSESGNRPSMLKLFRPALGLLLPLLKLLLRLRDRPTLRRLWSSASSLSVAWISATLKLTTLLFSSLNQASSDGKNPWRYKRSRT